jgi:E3 ubiquitin-protein ligase RNF5
MKRERARAGRHWRPSASAMEAAAASSEALVSTTSSSSDREARAEALSLFDCGVSCCCCCATLPFSTACAHALTTFFAAASLLTPPACRAPLQVCLDTASEPVITFCGHLYCWGCLYLWMKARADSGALCPLCKVPISEDCIIPVYGRGRSCRSSTSAASGSPTGACSDRSPQRSFPPPRPRPMRGHALSSGHAVGGDSGGTAAEPGSPAAAAAVSASVSGINAADAANDSSGAHGTHALSRLLTSLISQPAAFPSSSVAQDAVVGALSPEQVQQAFLSRLLLLLGSFVILCLLLI